MTATARDRAHTRAAELSCECDAIAAEIERLVTADNDLVQRECAVHGLISRRTAQLRIEQRALSGLIDGAHS